jgi:hypothetical protein
MQDAFESPVPGPQKGPGGIFRHPAVIALATLFGVAALYLLFFRGPVPGPSSVKQRLPFGSAEQAYAPRLQFSNFAMSEAENFLHQKVKYLDGDITNGGGRTLTGIEVVVEFRDDMNQIALRENRPILSGPTPALAPGATAHFQVSFDHVPASWNMQMPTAQVAGLQFATTAQ